MSTVRRAGSRGARLRLAVLVVALIALGAHFAITLDRVGRLDTTVAVVDAALALLLLVATSVHLRSLVRERQRLAVAELLLDLGAEPRPIRETAADALAALMGSGLADAGVIALADADEPNALGAIRPLAASGYPDHWIDDAPAVPSPEPGAGPTLQRAEAPHPWLDPLEPALGEEPWFAIVPLLAGSEAIGVLVLAARRPGAMRTHALLEMMGRPLGALLHQAELYEAAYERERELEEQATRHRDFLAAIAHEVRTPLTSIHAFAELLSADHRDDTESDLVASLMRGVERLTSLINDLLELGQSNTDAIRFHPEPLDVREVVELAETVLRPAFMLRGQTLRLELPERPLYATADRRHLEQVMMNLLSNANRHTPAAGEVTIRACRAAADAVRIEVEDSGPGVDPADRRRIFDAYYRVRRPGAQPVPGSGLGLAVARRLTQLQGGKIWVDDAPSGGARFCVELRGVAGETVLPAWTAAPAAPDEPA